jgi:hypothetical protein
MLQELWIGEERKEASLSLLCHIQIKKQPLPKDLSMPDALSVNMPSLLFQFWFAFGEISGFHGDEC